MSGKASRRKGATFEQAVRRWARDIFGEDNVTNPAATGYSGADMAIDGLPISWELKNHKTMKLASWVDQANEQAPDGQIGVVLHKRAGKGDIGDCYVTLSADQFVCLVLKGLDE